MAKKVKKVEGNGSTKNNSSLGWYILVALIVMAFILIYLGSKTYADFAVDMRTSGNSLWTLFCSYFIQYIFPFGLLGLGFMCLAIKVNFEKKRYNSRFFVFTQVLLWGNNQFAQCDKHYCFFILQRRHIRRCFAE